ncbi:hypothetical protein TRICI_003153 [Trichomonascus ciferrii]|uniref:NTF2-related export protein n=1 Tax=Trichomonascus ciferrii TaxID=44093 RepID=A0A642VAS6_9ASCO|nr:hypothetical protein TRICI_003153 [Trichomonascus ciferrii]
MTESHSFYNQFFKALDGYRQNLPQFLRPDTAIVWCGNPIGGGEAFLQMYAQMPETQHDVTEYNVHPLMGGNGAISMTLNTSGKVKFGSERGQNVMGFSAIFFLRKDPGSSQVQITSMSYRLVHKPSDATLQM